MRKIFFLIPLIFILFGCDTHKEERAMAVGRLSVYLSKIDKGDMIKKIKETYPDLQIGLIYYDPVDDTYKAVDPRKGFEKLGYSEAYNKEVYYYVMYRLTEKAIKEEHDYVKDELIKTLKEYRKFIEEAQKTEIKNRQVLDMVLKYGPIGILIFFILTGSGIAYLLFTIAKKHNIL
ncbi:hypothetical protein SAMN06265182_0516 [Persephonella hydrogeniphila]|uniref:Lipoprotein n=1 Tax=Persephonella hydrogeniphila TaxID=198703 RepID=A0A285N542_9AQUI|nr:hypothetical protein [Persephonella hydrogeniphila]SNZ03957.1 hypothetical protein SAMN06265182_0516 [Persephonella hydrogeniphila]